MPTYVSPGVYVIEKDISQYPPTINSSVVGLVGFASKGPVNKATLITSPNRLIDTFGEPSETIRGQGLEGALEILETTNSLYYVRAASTDAADASASIQFGSCPAVLVSGPNSDDNGLGVTGGAAATIYAQVYNNNGVKQYDYPKKFNIKNNFTANADASSQGKALAKVFGGSLQTGNLGVHWDKESAASGYIVSRFAGSGAYMELSAFVHEDNNSNKGMEIFQAVNAPSGTVSGEGIGGTASHNNFASAIKVYGGSIYTGETTSGFGYLVESLNPGAGYNAGKKPNGETSGTSITVTNQNGPYFSLNVNDRGQPVETFKCSLTKNKDFVEDVINVGQDNPKSDYIKGNLFASGLLTITPNALHSFGQPLTEIAHGWDGVSMRWQTSGGTALTNVGDDAAIGKKHPARPKFVKAIEGTYNLSGGNNGQSASDNTNDTNLIGTTSGGAKTGMQALDDEVLNISIAAVPGYTRQAVQNALISLAETTQDFLAVVAPPYAVGGAQDAIDWSNGQGGGRTAAITSNYAAIYWPWLKVFSVHDGKDRWYDPAIFAIRQMVYTDNVGEPWFAAAGYNRGRLTKPVDVEVIVNQGDRDSMYSGGNVINPIANFPQQGITIFGQRTAQRTATALDRVNIRRLMIFIRKVLLQAGRPFVFEPNDEFTWQQVEETLNPFLDDIKRRRGLVEFRVVCDDTVNTPVRVDRNELWCKVLLKPTKTAEIIIFELNLTNQSAQLGG